MSASLHFFPTTGELQVHTGLLRLGLQPLDGHYDIKGLSQIQGDDDILFMGMRDGHIHLRVNPFVPIRGRDRKPWDVRITCQGGFHPASAHMDGVEDEFVHQDNFYVDQEPTDAATFIAALAAVKQAP
jgi:hypothetical protein